MRPLPQTVQILIELPRGSFTKPRADGVTDFVSPLPCPFNYGCVPGVQAPDGDPIDVVVLGERREAGDKVSLPVRGVMGFMDDGLNDPKVICSEEPLTGAERLKIEAFFEVYAIFKRALNMARGLPGETRCIGWLNPELDPAKSGGPRKGA